ncbi:MAG TPA: hypothetical protein VGJ04_03300 [Pirellulales bacterium]
MNPRPYRIGFLTVLLLVALRVVMGWHFFQEGLAHKHDPQWSSAGFLRQAKGPLAEQFRRLTPGYHRWDELLAVPLMPQPLPTEGNPEGKPADAGTKSAPPDENAATLPNEGNPQGGSKDSAVKATTPDSPIYGQWYREIERDWGARRQEIENFYRFSDEQKGNSQKLLDRYLAELRDLLHGAETDMAAYRHELYRNGQMAAQPGADEIPNLKGRLAKREQNPFTEPGMSAASNPADWRADVEALESGWGREMLGLRSDEQIKLGPLVEAKTDLKKIDTAITWLLIVGGGLLMVGLFTRLSALALALFLMAVIATQPPWIAGTVETYYQGVECVALLALATSPVGRWAGLDFFVHYVLLWPFRSRRPNR